MSNIMEIDRRDDVAIATFANPPVNAISHAIRSAIMQALDMLQTDAKLRAMIIRCAGSGFFCGADIREFGRPPQGPMLGEVVAAIAASNKPVVAAIHGQALGGGLELAMACQGRVASAEALLGLPEVKLGLLPGAGGTQYLPRLAGAERAVEMICLGEPIDAAAALEAGLIDRLCHDDMIDDALALSRRLAEHGWQDTAKRPMPMDLGEHAALFARRHARRIRGQDAPAAILDVLTRSATLPVADGLTIEREAFERLRDGAQSAALRHLFAAERASGRLAELSGIEPRPVASVAVIGGGTMGSGIAAAALLADFAVIMVEQDDAALNRGAGRVRDIVVRRGPSRALDNFTLTLDWSAIKGVDVVIEAAFEDMAVKVDIFRRLGELARPGTILATNTSYLDVDAIAQASGRPQDALGLHFFSPAHLMKLLEIVRGAQTAPDCLASALGFAKRLGKVPVVAGNAHGFIGNRMLAVRKREAEKLLLRCGSPQKVDAALEDFGFAMGPFKVSDLAGLDLGWTAELSNPSILRDRMCEADRKGRKTGAGYYDYDDAGKPSVSEEANAIIARFAQEQGIEQGDIAPRAMLTQLLMPMIEEAQTILRDGVARCSADIDVVWVNGYGWPRWTGGPMYWASNLAQR